MARSRNPDRKRDKTLLVVDSEGSSKPFLRGMLTHDLVQRGLSFDDAYALAHAIRDQLADQASITTAELRDRVQEQLEERFGSRLSAAPLPTRRPSELQITFGGEPQPFSRGLLAQSLYAAGLDLDRAYRVALDIQQELERSGASRLDAKELAHHVGEYLDASEDASVGTNYRLLRRIRRLPKPLIIFLGGASGTGKSTLAVELAPLLRIYRMTSTDTVRQVMRMSFSAAMLPALHRSSFEVGEGESPSSESALLQAYEEQATRVCVGVRAVVERSIAENTSIIVEGVHLLPSIVPFADLEAAAYQLMLVLTTHDEEVHRSHLLARSNVTGRRADRYLKHFRAIRFQQDILLERAEDYEIPILDTTDRDRSVRPALTLLTGQLKRRVPVLASPEGELYRAHIPTLLLIIDGLPDRPMRAYGGRTPLEVARTPTLDRLALEGCSGLADPVAPDVVPDTAAGTLAVFGLSPHSMKRGPIEALGAGLAPAPGAVALRGNLATYDERGWVIDRRAGRIRQQAGELADTLDGTVIELEGDPRPITVRVRAGTEHRLAVVLEGEELSSEIVGSDPGEAAEGPALTPRAKEPPTAASVRTAMALELFERRAREILADHPINQRRQELGLPAANCVLTRGPGRLHQIPPLSSRGEQLNAACISGDRTVLGIATLVGAEVRTETTMTANLDTDLHAKLEVARQELPARDLVILHVKGADIASHDRRADLKIAFLERLDSELGRFLENHEGPLRIAIAADHATYAETGQHGADPVPILLWGTGVAPDSVETFSERAVSMGAIERIPLQLFVDKILAPAPEVTIPGLVGVGAD